MTIPEAMSAVAEVAFMGYGGGLAFVVIILLIRKPGGG